MLKIDFYESGRGETTIITFPDGGIGIIDAHPSPSSARPTILDLIKDKKIHFVCLSHPHTDHIVDLLAVIKGNHSIPIFWDTVNKLDSFVYYLSERPSFPSADIAMKIDEIREREIAPVLELFFLLAKQKITRRVMHDQLKPMHIAGVDIFYLWPTEDVLSNFTYKAISTDQDTNKISSVLVFKYGKTVFVHGGDAPKKEWQSVVKNFLEARFPHAVILKVPHHGSSDALDSSDGYLKICETNKEFKSIIFSGDVKHPSKKVFNALRQHGKGTTKIYCTSNGLKSTLVDPLGLTYSIPKVKSLNSPNLEVCNPIISLECNLDGGVSTVKGYDCTGNF